MTDRPLCAEEVVLFRDRILVCAVGWHEDAQAAMSALDKLLPLLPIRPETAAIIEARRERERGTAF